MGMTIKNDEFEQQWRSVGERDREALLNVLLIRLNGKELDVVVDRALPLSKWKAARDRAIELGGQTPFLLQSTLVAASFVVAFGVFWLNIPLWLRIILALALVFVSCQYSRNKALLLLRDIALLYPWIFNEYWNSGVIAIISGGHTFSCLYGNKWQDVVLRVAGYPHLVNASPISHQENLDEMFGASQSR